MASIRDHVQTARQELDRHHGPDVDDAHQALDTIEAHAKGENTAEHPEDLLDALAEADDTHGGLELPLDELADHFGVDDQDDEDVQDDVDELADLTHDQLYELAQDEDLEGRSTMDKDELVDALESAGVSP